MTLTTERITDLAAFRARASAWDAFGARTAHDSMFLTSGWLAAWWEALAGSGSPCVFLVSDSDGPVAAAPLLSRRTRWYGVPLREWCFLGDGTSDRQDFPHLPGREDALDVLWRTVLGAGGDLVRLEQVPAESAAARPDRGLAGLAVEHAAVMPYVPVDRSWDEYLASLNAKFRSEMRTRTKVFDGWGAWQCEHHEGPVGAALLQEIVAVETASPKSAAGTAFFAVPANLAFMSAFLAEPGPVLPRLSVFRLEGKPIAYFLGFIHGGAYHAYNGAMLAEYSRGSVGKWLMHKAIEHSFTAGLERFDFLRGATYMKTRWRPEERQNVRVVAFPSAAARLLLRPAVFGLRPRLKNLRRGGGDG